MYYDKRINIMNIINMWDKRINIKYSIINMKYSKYFNSLLKYLIYIKY